MAAHDEATAERNRTATAEILVWGRATFPGLRDGAVEVWTVPWPPSQEVRDAGLQYVSVHGVWFPSFSYYQLLLVPPDERGVLAGALALDQTEGDWQRLPMAVRLGIAAWWQDHAPGVRPNGRVQSEMARAMAQLGAELRYFMVAMPTEPVAADDVAGDLMAALTKASTFLSPRVCKLSDGTAHGLDKAWVATDPDPGETAVGIALAQLVGHTIGFASLHALCRAATERGDDQLPLPELLAALGVQDAQGLVGLLVQALDRATLGERLLQGIRGAAIRHDLGLRGIDAADPVFARELATRSVLVALGDRRELVAPPPNPK